METLFNQIQTILAENLEWLDAKNVDEDYNQLEMLYKDDEDSDTYPLTFPLVLIEIPETRWETLGGAYGKVQTGTVTVNVKLAIDCYDDTHYTSGTAEKISERADKVNQIHKLLQSYMPEGGSLPLNRVSSNNQTLTHGIKVYLQTYQCRVIHDVSR